MKTLYYDESEWWPVVELGSDDRSYKVEVSDDDYSLVHWLVSIRNNADSDIRKVLGKYDKQR